MKSIARDRIRATLKVALDILVKASIVAPTQVFYLCALRCPSCKKHIVGFTVFTKDEVKQVKHRIAIITNGVVVGFRGRH